MKKVVLIAAMLLGALSQAQNSKLLDADFWKSKPSVEAVQTLIAAGEDPAQFNGNAFDPVVLALLNGAPAATVEFLLSQKGNTVDKITHDSRIYLHWAAASGNPEIVRYLVEQGSDVNMLDSKGLSPLTFAVNLGMNNPEVFRYFFEHGVDPQKKYKDGANILLLAVGNDPDGSLLKLFEEKGLSLQDKDQEGNTAFDYAAGFGNLNLLKDLQKQGIQAHGFALIQAAQGKRRSTTGLEVYRYLIEDLKLDPASVSHEGKTALEIVAAKPNQTEIIKYLLEKGVDANLLDNQGNNALMAAAAVQKPEVLELLTPKIKDINHANKEGQTALTLALENSPEALAFLLAQNADAKIKDQKGNSLGYYLIQSYKDGKGEDFSQKKALLERAGLDLTQNQADGNSLLHLAVAKNSLDLLQRIADLKIDLNEKNDEGETVLHKAALLAKNGEILKYLVSRGADKTAKTEFEETAYDLALENENLKKGISLDFLKS